MDQNLLREFVREALNEAPSDPVSSVRSGLGLIHYDKGNLKVLVLFKVKDAAQRLVDAFKEDKRTPDEMMTALEPSIVGYVVGRKPKDPSWGAFMITSAAAERGNGPMMYDIAMDKWDRIMSDRNHVSPAAAKVWNFYANNRQDIKRLPLDDVDNPRTPSPQDDGKINPSDELDGPLNSAFEGAKTDTRALENAGHKFLLWAKASGLDVNVVKDAVRYAGSGYFRRRYLSS